jgi:uncharacterized membrane protein
MALTLVKLVHLLAWVMLVVSSIQKNRLISAQALDESAVLRLRRWDKVSGAMAGLMLLSGLGLLLWFAKPTSYYLNSEFFAVKMVFFTVGSLWIVLTKIWMRRTLRLAQWPQIPPASVRRGLRFDLLCLSVMSLCGLWLAHGSWV